MSHIIQHYQNETDIWRDAWRIADPGAANPVAVARTLFAASAFLIRKTGTDKVRNHPALRLMAAQLSYLYNVDSDGGSASTSDDFIMEVENVVKSLDAGVDLDVAITTANTDLNEVRGE